MLINIHTLKNRIEAVILNKGEQGYEINGSYEKWSATTCAQIRLGMNESRSLRVGVIEG